jgi:hypothetical protein
MNEEESPAPERSARMSSTSLLSRLTSLLLVASPALAQGGGFLAGDMYYYSPFLQGATIHSGGILRIDPLTGSSATHFSFDGSATVTGMLAFDPYRQRLVSASSPDGSGSGSHHAWFLDAAGAVTESGFTNVKWRSFAPVGDGRIYFHDDVTASDERWKWLDAANRVHVLLDASGTAPFELNSAAPEVDVFGMLWDAPTNSLFAATRIDCASLSLTFLVARRLTLSPDGTRVVAESCDAFDVDGSGAIPRGFSRGPAGEIFLACDTNAAGTAARMTTVDPVLSLISPWAENGSYSGAAVVTAGCWSNRVGRFLITNWQENKLRGYSFGDVGAGSYQVTVSQSLGVSTEAGTLIEIPFSDDEGGWIAYGAGLAGAGGRVPGLWGQGNPEPGQFFTLRLDEVVGGAAGTLFVGLASGATPLKGGTFHVGSVVLSAAIAVGGTPGVAGAGTLTLPAALPADPLLSGVSIYMQAGFSDAAAVKGVSLTQGLEMEIG